MVEAASLLVLAAHDPTFWQTPGRGKRLSLGVLRFPLTDCRVFSCWMDSDLKRAGGRTHGVCEAISDHTQIPANIWDDWL